MNNHQQKAKGISIFLWTIRVRLTMIKPPSPVEFPIFSPYFPHSFHRFYFLVNVALPNMLFAAMAGLQFFVDVDKVADRPLVGNPWVGEECFTTLHHEGFGC